MRTKEPPPEGFSRKMPSDFVAPRSQPRWGMLPRCASSSGPLRKNRAPRSFQTGSERFASVFASYARVEIPWVQGRSSDRRQFVTAPCRVVSAFVTGQTMPKSLTDNNCYGVTAPDPWTPRLGAWYGGCPNPNLNPNQCGHIPPTLNCLADFKPIPAVSKRFKPKKRKKEP